ncbi:MAG: hypothetical protein HDT37_05870 [Clostridiales bacterium]|nr:hypothetical protein [Clostridiales bacterium]
MLMLIMAMCLSYKNFVNDRATDAAIAWNDKNWPDFFKAIALMSATLFAPVFGFSVLLWAAYRWRKALLILAMIPILIASAVYRASHPGNAGDIDNGDGEKTPYEQALELYPIVLNFMFKVMVSASSSTVIDRKHDVRDIKVTLPTGENFSMVNGVPIYPFEVDVTDELTLDEADNLRDDLQRIGRNYIHDFPQLINTEAGRRDPFEVLAVHPLGRRIHVEVAQTTEASIPIINNCRRARAKRNSAPPKPPRYIDPDYGDE